MVNLTPNKLVFNLSGAELSGKVKAALETAVERHLILTGMQDIRLESVTTKTNLRGTFAKFVKGRVLRDADRQFDKQYVECALKAYEAKSYTALMLIGCFLHSQASDEICALVQIATKKHINLLGAFNCEGHDDEVCKGKMS